MNSILPWSLSLRGARPPSWSRAPWSGRTACTQCPPAHPLGSSLLHPRHCSSLLHPHHCSSLHLCSCPPHPPGIGSQGRPGEGGGGGAPAAPGVAGGPGGAGGAGDCVGMEGEACVTNDRTVRRNRGALPIFEELTMAKVRHPW